MRLSRRDFMLRASALMPMAAYGSEASNNWPSFRGPGGRGVADGMPVRTTWNADPAAGDLDGVLWRIPVPGVSHSSPVVWGDKIFLCTAISTEEIAAPVLSAGGRPTAAEDTGEHSWVVLCYNRKTGAELWRKTARKGLPRATHHVKATHANTSVAVDGKHVVAFFGSEGLYCYDLDGELLWSEDLGVINISKYGIGWGYASSPTIYKDRIALVCDDPDNPYVVVLRLSDGKEIWRKPRKEICERSWSTPLIFDGPEKTQVVVNGWPWILSYDLESGDELWRISGGGDNPVPTPFIANGWIYITSAHGKQSPIFVIRPEARGDISLPEGTTTNEAIVWSMPRGGSYMSTPVVYRDNIYLGAMNGSVRCFNAKTGEKVFSERLDPGAGVRITASLVATDGKIFCPSENGKVYVLAAGPDFNLLASNALGEPCLATPALAEGTLYFRTTQSLIAIQ